MRDVGCGCTGAGHDGGRVRTTRRVVEEPDPARVLLKAAPAATVHAVITVTRAGSGAGCPGESAMPWPCRAGIGWRLERWMLARFAPRVLAKELVLLAERKEGKR